MCFEHTLRSVYEYLKPLRDEKLMKCLRNVKIFCSHFFNASQVYIFIRESLHKRMQDMSGCKLMQRNSGTRAEPITNVPQFSLRESFIPRIGME